jgi:hypothetical protein
MIYLPKQWIIYLRVHLLIHFQNVVEYEIDMILCK